MNRNIENRPKQMEEEHLNAPSPPPAKPNPVAKLLTEELEHTRTPKPMPLPPADIIREQFIAKANNIIEEEKGGEACIESKCPSQSSSSTSYLDRNAESTFSVVEESFQSDEPKTLSEIFREKFGEATTARVYGFSTESLDHIKAHPDFLNTAPNPMKIPHDEVLNILNGFQNVFLAHEISVNPEFRLKRIVAPEDSIQSRIEKQMKKAYWDIFDENLNSTPPKYNHALGVFAELKGILLTLLLPHNHQMRNRINMILNVEELEEAVRRRRFTMLDFQRYANFIIDTLGQLCCPSRDADVAALKQIQKPSEVFQGVLEVMENMRLDMANFYIIQFRSNIVVHCVQQERTKLADYMEAEYRLGSDGLATTRRWIQRHRLHGRPNDTVLCKAFGEILSYNPTEPYPEVFLMDINRCKNISNVMTRLSIIGAIILTLGAVAQTYFTPLPIDFRDIVKQHMLILLPLEELTDIKKFSECLERAAEQAAFLVNEMTKKEANRDLTDREKDAVRNCVRDVGNSDHKIRSLLGRRIIDHAEEIALLKQEERLPIPGGLLSISNELNTALSEFQRIISHNRRAYLDLYEGIITNKFPTPKFITEPNQPWDESYVKTINSLRQNITDTFSDDSIVGAASNVTSKVSNISAEIKKLAVKTEEFDKEQEALRVKERMDKAKALGLAEGKPLEQEEEEGVEKHCDSKLTPLERANKKLQTKNQVPAPFVKHPFMPMLPKKYLLKSAKDGLARLIPNLAPAELRKNQEENETIRKRRELRERRRAKKEMKKKEDALLASSKPAFAGAEKKKEVVMENEAEEEEEDGESEGEEGEFEEESEFEEGEFDEEGESEGERKVGKQEENEDEFADEKREARRARPTVNVLSRFQIKDDDKFWNKIEEREHNNFCCGEARDGEAPPRPPPSHPPPEER